MECALIAGRYLTASNHSQTTNGPSALSIKQGDKMNLTAPRTDSRAWIVRIRASFFIPLLAACLGIFYLPTDLWVKGYMAIRVLLALTATLTLTKTARDNDGVRKLLALSGITGLEPLSALAQNARAETA